MVAETRADMRAVRSLLVLGLGCRCRTAWAEGAVLLGLAPVLVLTRAVAVAASTTPR